MYNVLLFTSNLQEDKWYYYINNYRSNEQFNIALVLVLLYCMHAQGTPMACHRMKKGLGGTEGTHRAPCLFPMCHRRSNIVSGITYCGCIKKLLWP